MNKISDLRNTLLLILLLGLYGCTVGPDYVKPEVDTPETWRYEVENAADIVNTRWWMQFNDPVLDRLIQIALENNKDVRIAAARVEEFTARVSIARSGLYPQLGYNAGARRFSNSEDSPGTPGINDSYLATINVGWELDVWGKIRRSTEAARAQLLAQEEARRTVILTLVSAVAQSYVELRSLDRQLEIALRTLATRAETLVLFQIKFEGGVVSDLEVAQIRSEYEEAAVRIPAIENQIALQENAISILLGRNPGVIVRGKDIDHLILPAVPSGIPSQLLARRPDIQLAEQNLIAANAQIGVARAQYFPSISLTGLFGYASTSLSDLFSSSTDIWDTGAALLGPIFTGGRISGQVRATEAVQRQALIIYMQTIQSAFREVDDALVTTRKTREELQARTRRVEALNRYSQLARLRYDEGQVSFIEVLDADRRLFDAELLRTQNQSSVYLSLVNMYKTMGGGWVLQAENMTSKVGSETGKNPLTSAPVAADADAK